MSGRDPLDDLRERYLGQRFYNTDIDEACTIVDIDPPFALLQYDDGTFRDEAIDADTLTKREGDRFGLDEHGLEAE